MDNSLNVSATSIYNPKKRSWNDKARWEMPSTWKAGLPISMEHVKSLTTREGSAPRLGAVRHRYRYTWQLPATTAASIVPARLLSSAYLRLDNLFGIVIVTYCPPAHAHSYAPRYYDTITNRWNSRRIGSCIRGILFSSSRVIRKVCMRAIYIGIFVYESVYFFTRVIFSFDKYLHDGDYLSFCCLSWRQLSRMDFTVESNILLMMMTISREGRWIFIWPGRSLISFFVSLMRNIEVWLVMLRLLYA